VVLSSVVNGEQDQGAVFGLRALALLPYTKLVTVSVEACGKACNVPLTLERQEYTVAAGGELAFDAVSVAGTRSVDGLYVADAGA